MSQSNWRQVEQLIRDVLNTEWDPIGVADVVTDEYDTYIGGLYGLLRSGASDRVVSEHLLGIETEEMGIALGSPASRLQRVVERLRALELPRVAPLTS